MDLRPFAFAAALAAAAAPAAAVRAQTEPAVTQIEALDAGLLDIMKQASSLGVQGRYRKIRPVVEQVYDLPVMTRFAVGPKWGSFAPQDQSALIQAFARLTAANYAHEFDGYAGERLVVDPAVQSRGPDRFVKSQILSSGKPTDLTYRMRQGTDGRWRVIDVYYGSISQMVTRRSDFASSVDSGGAPVLLKKINALADKLMRG